MNPGVVTPVGVVIDGDSPFDSTMLCNLSQIENTMVRWSVMDTMRERVTEDPEVWVPSQYLMLLRVVYGVGVSSLRI